MVSAEGASSTADAATVVLLRDGPEGLETLLARRNARGSFGGLWVFPGGRVDPGDSDPERPGDELAAARRAAVREVLEEVGVVLPAQTLVPLSHWTPPPSAPRRFLTWFFLAPVDEGTVPIVIDDAEIVDSAWLRPRRAIERRDAGEIDLAPPTWVTLWRLAQSADVATALRWAAEREPERFVSVSARGPNGMVLLQPGDAGWEARDPTLAGPRHRLNMAPGGWRYERDIGDPGRVAAG